MTTPTRLLIIGLDGATPELVGRWTQAGKLPVLARLIEQGAWARLRSVMPVLSPSAWASFMTGVNPGRHGIYDFMRRQPGGYGLRLTHLGHNQGTPFWRLVNAQGRKAIVLNVPTTYPPEALDGVMASGLGTPDFKPFTYPEALGAELTRRGYTVNLHSAYKVGQEQAYRDAQHKHTEEQAHAARWLLREQPWDVALYVVRGTDEMAHYYWRHMDPTHPAHDPLRDKPWEHTLLEYYQLCDRVIGNFLEDIGPETAVMIMSDHGLGPLYKDVYLNEWLRQQGHLVLRTGASSPRTFFARVGLTRSRISAVLRGAGLGRVERLIKDVLGERIAVLPRDRKQDLDEAVDWSRTRAYSFGYHGQIYLNVKGREPQGIVAPGADYEAVRDDIMERLARLVDPDDGLPVISAQYRREELYSGPAVEDAPDIVAIMRDLGYITRQGYEFGAAQGQVFGAPQDGQSGSHRLDGVVVVAGPGFARYGAERPVVGIMDLLPTFLHVLGLTVPDGLDGQVLVEWLDAAARERAVVRGGVGQVAAQGGAVDFTAAEEAEVTRRLRDLGYLG